MIKYSPDPTGLPSVRKVYLRTSSETGAIIPPSTGIAFKTASDDGVISLVSRQAAASPAAGNLIAGADVERFPVVMELYAWQTAQTMQADPMLALRSQRAPDAENVAGLLGA